MKFYQFVSLSLYFFQLREPVSEPGHGRKYMYITYKLSYVARKHVLGFSNYVRHKLASLNRIHKKGMLLLMMMMRVVNEPFII